MEQETVAAAVGKDPDEEQNAHDSSSTTGKKADEDQQILLAIEDTNWYRSTQALKYLQPVFMQIVRNEMKSLQLQSMNDFGRQLCEEATADDIRPVNGWLAKFKHLCPGTLVACQNLLNIIKGHTSDSVNFYQMLKGTDPQQWLKSPFEFVRLFLKDWMRCDIHDFQECDITALCTIVKRCKPLMQIFDERKIDDLRNVRNRTMHPATMSISQEEMENNIDVILDFLEHIQSLKSTDEVTEAIESIKQLRTGDVRLLHSMVVRLIQGWLPGARLAYEHNSDKAKNQLQDIMYMETILATLSSGQQITQSAGLEFGAKKEENRELEKQNEELRKRLQIQQEENRELEEQNKKLHRKTRRLEQQKEVLFKCLHRKTRRLEQQKEVLFKCLHIGNRELEKQKEELLKQLEEKRREITFELMREGRRRWLHFHVEELCKLCEVALTPTPSPADEFDDTYCMELLGLTTPSPADEFDDTYCMELLGLTTPSPETDSDEDWNVVASPRKKGENAAYKYQADDFDEITYGMNSLDEPTNCIADEFDENTYSLETLGLPTPDPCTVTVESDSTTAGENADQDHQILTDESDTNWFKTTQSLKYLLPVLLSFIEDKIIRLHEKTLTDFGRQLCTEATSDDIIRAEGNVAHFKHLCPGTVVTCQNLLKIIKGHTIDSVDFYQMLKGTDPQNWLKSPFEFARLFLKDWMRSDIHDFQDCDILALCTIIKRCKPLMQIFDERKLDELRNVRNRTMHPYTMSICQHEMEDHINAILDFLEQMKTLTNTGEVIKAMESITQSRTDDVRSRQTIFVRLIQGWLPGAKMEYKHKLDEANNQLKDIHHMENKLVRVSAAQEAKAGITQRSS